MNLTIGSRGFFRILEMSDIQERADFSPRTFKAMEYLIDTQQPDLVMLGGDNCFGPDIKNAEALKSVLNKLAEPMESRGIPWAHIFGNHDHDVRCVTGYELQTMYERFPHCISAHSTGLHWITNYCINVMDVSGGILLRIWCLDTNGSLEDSSLNARFGEGGLRTAAVLPVMPGNNDRYDILYFDQLVWYDRESKALLASEGRTVPGVMFCHIAPEEFSLARDNPKECALTGSAVEKLGPAVFNSGLFSLLVQRGDVRLLSCGHTHMNAYQADYCGITLCFDACAGYTCYGLDTLRGGRIIDFYPGCERLVTRMVNTVDVIPLKDSDHP